VNKPEIKAVYLQDIPLRVRHFTCTSANEA
jgi:hypothetical protein